MSIKRRLLDEIPNILLAVAFAAASTQSLVPARRVPSKLAPEAPKTDGTDMIIADCGDGRQYKIRSFDINTAEICVAKYKIVPVVQSDDNLLRQRTADIVGKTDKTAAAVMATIESNPKLEAAIDTTSHLLDFPKAQLIAMIAFESSGGLKTYNEDSRASGVLQIKNDSFIEWLDTYARPNMKLITHGDPVLAGKLAPILAHMTHSFDKNGKRVMRFDAAGYAQDMPQRDVTFEVRVSGKHHNPTKGVKHKLVPADIHQDISDIKNNDFLQTILFALKTRDAKDLEAKDFRGAWNYGDAGWRMALREQYNTNEAVATTISQAKLTENNIPGGASYKTFVDYHQRTYDAMVAAIQDRLEHNRTKDVRVASSPQPDRPDPIVNLIAHSL